MFFTSTPIMPSTPIIQGDLRNPISTALEATSVDQLERTLGDAGGYLAHRQGDEYVF